MRVGTVCGEVVGALTTNHVQQPQWYTVLRLKACRFMQRATAGMLQVGILFEQFKTKAGTEENLFTEGPGRNARRVRHSLPPAAGRGSAHRRPCSSIDHLSLATGSRPAAP